MGKYSDKFNQDDSEFFWNSVKGIIYIIACIVSLGLVWLMKMIIETGVKDSLRYLELVATDIEDEVDEIKKEVSELKLEIRSIQK